MLKIIRFLPARVAKAVSRYKDVKKKLVNTSMSISFNKQCEQKELVPTYLKNFINFKNCKKDPLSFRPIVKKLISDNIKILHSKKDALNVEAYDLFMEITQLCHEAYNVNCDTVWSQIIDYLDNYKQGILYRHEKKISKLFCLLPPGRSSQNVFQKSNHVFYPKILNKTSIHFTLAETCLLEKGLKYNVKPDLASKQVVQNVLVDLKAGLDYVKVDNASQTRIAYDVTNIISKYQASSSNISCHDKSMIKNINKKLKENDALITKSDKGSSVVIAYNEEYISKTMLFFEENGISELQDDPTPSLQKEIRAAVNNANYLLKPYHKKSLINMNPQPPKLRAQFKIHKTNHPIRPISNSQNSAYHDIARFLHDRLKKSFVFTTCFSVSNSAAVVHKIEDIACGPVTRLFSLDIKNLYTNVPVLETLKIVEENLRCFKKDISDEEITDFMNLINIVVKYNYFEFNGQLFQQNDGLAMGNPLAGILADIFINSLEIKLFSSFSFADLGILSYCRYVDDILIIYNGLPEGIDRIYKLFNDLHKNITFTCELENENRQLNFLDLTLSITDNRISFNIFRKETQTDQIVPASSTHPIAHKNAFFFSAVHRALSVPLSKENLNKEINLIKTIAVNNGYDARLVDDIIRKKINKKGTTLGSSMCTPEESEKIFFSIPFLGPVSYRIQRLLRQKYQCNIAFSTNNSLKKIFIHNLKSTADPLQNSGVYKISCDTCGAYYIGQTGRAFSVRCKEHLLRKNGSCPPNSSFADHLLITGHSPKSIDNLEILHVEKKGRRLDIWEQLEIFKHFSLNDGMLLNEQLQLRGVSYFKGIKPLLEEI